jgi:hypothetical protein
MMVGRLADYAMRMDIYRQEMRGKHSLLLLTMKV